MVIADTGFLLALANRSDRDHLKARQVLSQLDEALITTWPVITETTHLLANRLGVSSLLSFVSSVRNGAFTTFELKPVWWSRIEALMHRYKNLPMDLADASLVILAEEQNDGRILTTDRGDFASYRWKSRRPFINLLDR
jgi:predicted nucleic acid-binding protein